MVVSAKTGKKKIMPVIERVYEDTNAEVNPHMNPFMQLAEDGSKDVVMEAPVKPAVKV